MTPRALLLPPLLALLGCGQETPEAPPPPPPPPHPLRDQVDALPAFLDRLYREHARHLDAASPIIRAQALAAMRDTLLPEAAALAAIDSDRPLEAARSELADLAESQAQLAFQQAATDLNPQTQGSLSAAQAGLLFLESDLWERVHQLAADERLGQEFDLEAWTQGFRAARRLPAPE
ncbi:MAG: hypothetical protein AAF555_11180 [Verrucomicrobiota bacterium]